MNRLFLSLVIIITLISFAFSNDMATLDKLLDEGKYNEALPVAEQLLDKNNPDAKVLWKLGRVYYELGESAKIAKKKPEALSTFDKGMIELKPFIDGNASGELIDKARVVYWYDVLYSSKSRAIGIFESLGKVPELIELADKAISIYKEFGEPYHLKAKIDEAVPGRDKFMMGLNFNSALKYDPAHITFLIDAADAFYSRNWDSKRRENEGKKNKLTTDGTPSDLTDKEYAKQLLNKAISVTEKKGASLTFSEKNKYEEAKTLAKKIK